MVHSTFSRFSRVVFVLSLGIFWLSETHAVAFENCASQGPVIFGSFATQSRNANTNGYKSTLGGFGFLWDIYSLPFIKFGIGLSAAASRIELGDNAISRDETQKVNYITPSFHTRLHYGWGFLSLSPGVGPAHFKTSRVLNGSNTELTGKFNGMLASIRGTLGISIPIDNFEITPMMTIDHGRLKKGTNIETGGNLTVTTAGGKIKAQQQSFGIRFAEISEPNIFYPEFHIFTFTDTHVQKLRVISRFLEGIPSYVQDGITPKKAGLNLGCSLTSTLLGEATFLTAGFDYETRKGYQGYSAFLRLRFF